MKPGIILVLVLLGFSACMPAVGLQSGRSLGKENAVITPYLHGGDIWLPRDDSEEYSKFLPSFGAQFAIGITDRLDLGGKVDLSSFVSFQAKYQFLGNQRSKWAMSAGAEAGIMVFPILLGGLFYYYTTPLFISYHPNEKLCFYAIPRYTFGHRYVVAGANGNGLDAFWHTRRQSGFAYGFSVGAKNKFSLEVGHFSYQLHLPTQVALGYSFWFGK